MNVNWRRSPILSNGVYLLLFAVLSVIPLDAPAQLLPIGGLEEEQYQIRELLHGSSGIGYTNRPIWRLNSWKSDGHDLNVEDGQIDPWWDRPLPRLEESFPLPWTEDKHSIRGGLWSPSMQLTTNSRHPYGENNAAAWYGRGLSSEFQLGWYIVSEYLTISLRPHLIWQQNNEFPEPRFVPLDPTGESWFTTEGIGDRVDAPFRFGPDSFWTLDPGHSSIRAHIGAFEAGYGTDPLWWGPAGKYPLMMSNNAPGFAHTFLGMRRPFHVPYVGDIQVRWIGGRLAYSDWYHEGLRDVNFDQMDRLGSGESLNLSDSGHRYGEGVDRYLSGLHISWSPTLLPNLTFGLTRLAHSPLPDGKRRWEDIRAVIDPFQLKNLQENQGDSSERKDRYVLNSIYARWIWPESQFELFGEFMRDDYAWDWRDFLMEPHHSSGYSFGFRKLFATTIPRVRWIRSHLEFTNLTPSYLVFVRPQGYRYASPSVPAGHTHKGKYLGAAIGPGSNSQFFQLDALIDWGRVGLFFQRTSDNNQFHYEYDQSLGRASAWGDYKRHRTDLTIGSEFLWFVGPIALTGKASWTTMMNYGRFDYDHYGPQWGWEEFTWNDLRNVHLQLGVQWLLN